jgi:hypothetical protein
MDDELLEFLQRYKNKAVWVFVPSGIISGIVESFDPLTPEMVTLRNASIQRGDAETDVAAVTILTAQISAWGLTRKR